MHVFLLLHSSERPVMQQPVYSSTHHILSRLYAEPQLILMLSMWYGPMKNKAPAVAALHPPPALRETTEGQQNYMPALLFVHCFQRMQIGIQSLLILLTYEWPQRIPVQICCIEWSENVEWKKPKTKKKPHLFVVNRKYTQQSCECESECLFDVMVHFIITCDTEQMKIQHNSENKLI